MSYWAAYDVFTAIWVTINRITKLIWAEKQQIPSPRMSFKLPCGLGAGQWHHRNGYIHSSQSVILSEITLSPIFVARELK